MKALVRILALSIVATTTALPALADRGGHGGHRGHGYHGGHWKHHGHHGHHGHGHGHGHRHGVWGPLILGGLVGAAIVGAHQAQASPSPQTVFVPVAPPAPSHLVQAPAAPPLVLAPAPQAPPRVQYYCAPYRAHWPQVQSCPEPWYVTPY